ncbi:MAG: LysR family transcriptional regulator, partial [Phenylobacterium sp.]
MATLPDIELRLLRAFTVLAEELNFGRAAERLHMTQPALSAQIRQLEHRLDLM